MNLIKQVLLLTVLTVGCSDPDEVILEVIPQISKDTKFTLKERGYPSKPLYSGKLGRFAECLKGYRGITHRNTKQKGRSVRQELWISETTFIDIVSINGEVFYFTVDIVKTEDKKSLDSRTYSVNCNLSLLDVAASE
ncbi:hypothetical protein [Thalassotalea sp. G2M2-11]|uniref:hypothetical protein n=1 Tax=Thalassotalea sp. G2M2-11 TaxID=2787627 RepID=UPI0019D2B124|nr:hypothetical protein [Thalassotalea sp. G2M2-11]